MNRIIASAGAVLCACLTFTSAGYAATERHALVVGNSEYSIGALANPANDARLMENALKAVGFEVTVLLDASEREFNRALVEFRNRLKLAEQADSNAVALFYFAGHAVQANGENYLIPVDAEIEDEIDLEFEGVSLDTIMATLQRSGADLKLVFLDACRNNPYDATNRSSTRGLSAIDNASGTLISFATQPGNVAEDGTGENSTYTRSLARYIQQEGLLATQVMTRVRADVMERTGGQQEPWASLGLDRDFYFVEPETPRVVQEEAPVVPERVDGHGASTIDLAFWQSIDGSTNPEMYQAYLDEFPEGQFRRLAQIRMRELTNLAAVDEEPEDVAPVVRNLDEEQEAAPEAEDAELHGKGQLSAPSDDETQEGENDSEQDDSSFSATISKLNEEYDDPEEVLQNSEENVSPERPSKGGQVPSPRPVVPQK